MSKSHHWNELELLPVVEAARRRRINPATSLLLFSIISLIISFIIWAAYAEVDEVTRAEGRVVPSSKTQEVQNLEGGLLSELMVKEGNRVKAGQIILRIDNTIALSALKKRRTEYLTYLAEKARFQAEASGKDPVFPDEVLKEAPELAINQKALFFTHQKELNNDINILEQLVSQRNQELTELNEKIRGLERSTSLLKQELELNRPLLKIGATSQSEILQMERMHSERLSELNEARLAIPRGQAAKEEALGRINARRLEYKREALGQIDLREARLANIREGAMAEEDRVRRTEVISPVNGIVNRIHFTTVNSVIQPGDTIVEIIPIEDNLLIEAWIPPQDVAFLRPGLKGKVAITAYDSAIFGNLDAKLEDISADTFDDREGGFGRYQIHMRTDKNMFEKDGEEYPIIPGMTATVDILTGKKTILDYLLKPILKTKQIALTER
ncbi:MAG: HlyD family type I secretion periplasmic adaptor subunit [Magnetococcales bacterium]|nr:HlyD family type I secretion periplasmic adaptor subunit [Magnetococcales bacterium]